MTGGARESMESRKAARAVSRLAACHTGPHLRVSQVVILLRSLHNFSVRPTVLSTLSHCFGCERESKAQRKAGDESRTEIQCHGMPRHAVTWPLNGQSRSCCSKKYCEVHCSASCSDRPVACALFMYCSVGAVRIDMAR